MRIGMTYDLRDDYLEAGYGLEETAEFDRQSTITALEEGIRAMGHEPVRIGNIVSLVSRLAKNESWDLVFNIAEGLYGFGREAQVPALLDAYRIAYVFSGPLVQAVTLHKAIAKHIVKNSGLATPDFTIVHSDDEVAAVELAYPLFAKPVAEGTGKGVSPASKVGDNRMLAATCHNLLRVFKQPVLVETFLPGREFTVGIVGNGADAEAIGIMEVVLLNQSEPDVYSYHNKEHCEELVEYRLVDDEEARQAAELALACYRVLGCQDAARVDIRSDGDGRPCFIEVNPLAGLHPEHSDLCILAAKKGISYQQLLERIIDAALKRQGISS